MTNVLEIPRKPTFMGNFLGLFKKKFKKNFLELSWVKIKNFQIFKNEDFDILVMRNYYDWG